MAVQMTRCRTCGHMYDPTQRHVCQFQCPNCSAVYYAGQQHVCAHVQQQQQAHQQANTIHIARMDELLGHLGDLSRLARTIMTIIVIQAVLGLIAAILYLILAQQVP